MRRGAGGKAEKLAGGVLTWGLHDASTYYWEDPKGRKVPCGRSTQYRVSFVFKGTCQTMQLCHTPTHILRVDYNKHTTDAMEQRQSTLLKLFSQASRPDIYQAPGSGYSLRRIAETVCCIGLLRRGQAFQLIEQSSSIATELHIAIV